MTLPTPPAPRFVLVYRNTIGEKWFFVALGQDARLPGRWLIRETTKDASKATVFNSVPEAMEVLAKAVAIPEWAVEAL